MSRKVVRFFIGNRSNSPAIFSNGDLHSRQVGTDRYPVSEGGRRGQSCTFFESVLAKKVRTDPAPAVTDPLPATGLMAHHQYHHQAPNFNRRLEVLPIGPACGSPKRAQTARLELGIWSFSEAWWLELDAWALNAPAAVVVT